MKKILILGAVIAFIVPQIALASWWNPFSWNIFHKADTKTQILENRIQELEKKLEKEIATTTPAVKEVKNIESVTKKAETKTTLKQISSSSQETQTVQKTTSAIAQSENFSSIVVSSLLAQAKSYQDLADFVDGTIKYIDIAIDELDTLIAQHEGYVSILGPQKSELSQALIAVYKEDIAKSNVFKSNLLAYKDTANKNAEIYKNSALKKSTVLVTRQELLSILETLQADTNWNLSKDYIFTTYENYKTYRKNKDNYYVKMDAQLRALYSQMGTETNTTAYKPQPVPQIQLPAYTPPQFTNCTITGDGGVGLQAHINCSTSNF